MKIGVRIGMAVYTLKCREVIKIIAFLHFSFSCVANWNGSLKMFDFLLYLIVTFPEGHTKCKNPEITPDVKTIQSFIFVILASEISTLEEERGGGKSIKCYHGRI